MGPIRQMAIDLLKAARSAEDRTFVRLWHRQTGDIKVGVTQCRDGYIVVTMEQADAAPAHQDWSDLLSCWPELVPPGVTPQRRTEGRSHRLIGRWPRPAAVGERA